MAGTHTPRSDCLHGVQPTLRGKDRAGGLCGNGTLRGMSLVMDGKSWRDDYTTTTPALPTLYPETGHVYSSGSLCKGEDYGDVCVEVYRTTCPWILRHPLVGALVHRSFRLLELQGPDCPKYCSGGDTIHQGRAGEGDSSQDPQGTQGSRSGRLQAKWWFMHVGFVVVYSWEKDQAVARG